MDALLNSLTEKETMLLLQAQEDRLAMLDEDALIDLHTRMRRARNRHVKVYRRSAALRVEDAGGRGKGYARNARNRAKAEVFEGALAEVSRRLAEVAQSSADELRAQRLERERADRTANEQRVVARAGRGRRQAAVTMSDQTTDRRPDGADLIKRAASTRAVGARRQARRDGR
nr:hypothetical protein [uncultured Actinoplanes sp.]